MTMTSEQYWDARTRRELIDHFRRHHKDAYLRLFEIALSMHDDQRFDEALGQHLERFK